MARSAEGRRLTEAHRRGQVRIASAVLRDFTRLWPLWRGDEKTFRRLADATVPLIRVHHGVSASLAAAYFVAFRRAEGPGGAAAPVVALPPREGEIAGTLLVTGHEMTRNATAAGQSPQKAMQTALVRTSGTVVRQTLNGGRDTVVLSSARDRSSGGWARVTAGRPCAFCAMLATRGAVFSESTADFQAHDHCLCSGEPFYAGSSLPPASERFRGLYNEAQRAGGASGTSNDALNNFRRLLAAQ